MPLTETTPRIKQHLTWIELDLRALEANLEKIKMLTLPSAEILAVIKANGYGHGLLEIAEVLGKQVGYLGVASIEEALTLRQRKIETPILLFGIHLDEQIRQAIDAQVTLSVSSFDQAKLIEAISRELNRAALVHVKVDTGMGRLGIPLRSAKTEIMKIQALDALKLEGIYTHFPVAEETDPAFTEKQIRDFHALLAALGERGISFAYRHAANSAGLFNYRDAHLNLVRPGLALYGIYPDPSLISKVHLEPVLNWRTRVILIKPLQAGDSVGYGRTFTATEKTSLAILPIGYSHGYPVSASSKSRVLVRGRSHRVIGRVSMDYMAVETGDHSVQVGDIATVIGKDGTELIRAEELADICATISYEILTRIHPQIPRIVSV